MTPARKMALLFSACAILASGLVAREGWELKAAPDPVHGNAVPTACAGVTHGIDPNRTYTEAECVQITMLSVVKHAAPIQACIVHDMPPAFLAEMADMSFNIGSGGFLKSTMCRQMKAGNYPAACDAILLYYRAGAEDCRTSRKCRGLWLRRQDAHRKCRAALK